MPATSRAHAVAGGSVGGACGSTTTTPRRALSASRSRRGTHARSTPDAIRDSMSLAEPTLSNVEKPKRLPVHGAQVRCSAPTHSAASSVESVPSSTVVVLSAGASARRASTSPSRSASATRTAARPDSAMKSATESSETFRPGMISPAAGILVARTSSGPNGTRQPGERHRSAVQTAGRFSSASTTIWVMVFGRPVASAPAGAVCTRTVPSAVGTWARRRAALPTSSGVGKPDRGATGFSRGSTRASRREAVASSRVGDRARICQPPALAPSTTRSVFVYSSWRTAPRSASVAAGIGAGPAVDVVVECVIISS